MLDERSKILLKKVNERCTEGSFNVIDKTELLSVYPKRFKADETVLEQSLKNLSAYGYVLLKYEDENVYCLAPTPKGRAFYEDETELKTIDRRKLLSSVFNSVCIYLAVFFGIIGAFSVLTANGAIC